MLLKLRKTMKQYKYSLFAKFVYRFANIPITLLLLVSVIASVSGLWISWKYWIPVIIHLVLIYIINRAYFRIYKYFPFLIEADNTKLICSDFYNSSKKVTIPIHEITKIEGGIFSGNKLRALTVYWGDGGSFIGINQHIKDYNSLVTTILANTNKPLYDSLLNKMHEFGVRTGEKKNNKSKKQKAR